MTVAFDFITERTVVFLLQEVYHIFEKQTTTDPHGESPDFY
jgi:hypothetical protein